MAYAKQEYKKFRVKTPVRSFRDLEVYRQTTALSVAIFNLAVPKQYKRFEQEFAILKQLSKPVPKLIAESYGRKFSSISQSLNKLEEAMERISTIIAKIDFLIIAIDLAEFKEQLMDILKKYQRQRFKILNLKRAWERVFGGNSK